MKKSSYLYLAMAMLAVCFSSFALTSCGDDDEEQYGEEVIEYPLLFKGERIAPHMIRITDVPESVETPLKKGMIIRHDDNLYDKDNALQPLNTSFFIVSARKINNTTFDMSGKKIDNSKQEAFAPQYLCEIYPYNIETTGDWIEGDEGNYKIMILPFFYNIRMTQGLFYEANKQMYIHAGVEEGDNKDIKYRTICFDRNDIPNQKFMEYQRYSELDGDILNIRIKRYKSVEQPIVEGTQTFGPSKFAYPYYFCEVELAE